MGHITIDNKNFSLITASRTTRERIERLLKKSKRGFTAKEIAIKVGASKREVEKQLKQLILEGKVNVESNSQPPRYFWIIKDMMETISVDQKKKIENGVREYFGDLEEWDEIELNVALSTDWKNIAILSGLNSNDNKSFDIIKKIVEKLKKSNKLLPATQKKTIKQE